MTNLFFKKIFGVLESTRKMEVKDNQLFADLIHYKRFEASDEYAEYKRLLEIVSSADFKEKRKTLKTRKYKETQEYIDVTAFEKLEKNADLKLYFQIVQSKALIDYLAFKESADYAKLNDEKEIEKSPKIKEYKAFESSKEFQHYARFHNSFPAQEYIRLKEKLATPEFKESNAFWQDPNRWETTEEYAQEKRMRQIAESEDGKFFFSTDPRKFRRIENLVVYKKDTFEYKSLKDSPWKAGFYYINPELKTVHSAIDELQANMGGKNIALRQGLSINTKHEKTNALVWHPEKGFVEKEYNFTSDIVSGYDVVAEEYCGIRVKMRCSGKVNHAFWLSSGEKIPQINVALIKGKTIEVGVYDARGDYYYSTVRGINPSNYYIYSIYQKDDSLIWKINNIEVFRTRNIISGRRFFPCFSSFIPDTQKNPTEGSFDIEWVEVYK